NAGRGCITSPTRWLTSAWRSESSPSKASSWSTRSRDGVCSGSRSRSYIPTPSMVSSRSSSMADADDRVVVEIAFDGGQIMGARLTSSSADELEQALASRSDGALTLDADDGRYMIPLARVVYVKRFTREARLGFTSSS